jgi:hypothetical protein
VVGRIRPESTDLYLSSVDSSVWVDNDSEERIRKLLLHHLGLNVDAAEPASVSRVAVVPSNDVFRPSLSSRKLGVFDQVFVGVGLCIHSRLRTLDRQPERICNNKSVARNVALHTAHDLKSASGASVHDHLDEGYGTYADVLEVVDIFRPWLRVRQLLLGGGIVDVECIALRVYQLDIVVKL